MKRNTPISGLGWNIKRRLAELQIDQKTFCKQNGIPEHCLSRLITGKGKKYRKEVLELLGIKEGTEL